MAAPTAPRVLVLAGHGRYEDPWHDTAATSHRVAAILAGHGMDVDVRGTFPSAHEHLAGADLLVVNAGHGRVDPSFDGTDADWAPFHDAVRDHAAAGRGVLGLHQAANTFADSPHWAQVLGGRWVEGRSMHPPIGPATFDVVGEHPVVRALGDLGAYDERYSFLTVLPGSEVLARHHHDGADHPVVWAREAGAARVVYDALGHGTESYDSPARRRLLVREALWLLGAGPEELRAV